MKRSLVLGAVLTVGLCFGGAVAAGAVDLPSFDAGPDTMLCYNRSGAVTQPVDSACPRGGTEFFVAGSAQVDAIEVALASADGRLAVLEAASAPVASRLDALEDVDESVAAQVAALEDANDALAAGLAALDGVDESVAALEAASASVSSRLAALEQDVRDLKDTGPPSDGGTLTLTAIPGTAPDTWGFILEGEGLKPNSTVHGWSQLDDGAWDSGDLTVASPHGIVYHDGSIADFPCDLRLTIYFSGTGDGPEGDTPVLSRTLTTGPSCG